MPMGFCSPPVCFNLTYNFGGAGILVIKPKDVPTWAKGLKMPLGSFPALETPFVNRTNAGARLFCDKDCVCMRLHKNAITAALPPQRLGPHPLGKADIYMEGITVTGFWGMCLPIGGGVRVQKGGKWYKPEELPDTEILTPPPSSPGSGGSSHKKGKKPGKKKRRR